ncbi:peptidase inhibitor family I36 protein [Nonomuraea jiangxiensis]|uniref:Peptidase inhibitor family I36 n=1 Tax=Nonomuraea jiangxiensis TaxID=633440 RepID=A0A1G8WA16_9ACTN|nr:peptidase inhibitor family I36 protein [Nonomuraea jiangxiensis]SDJ75122.1 Peptidase inhibitor family I36 [Nonomuraea jiangxiensis]
MTPNEKRRTEKGIVTVIRRGRIIAALGAAGALVTTLLIGGISGASAETRNTTTTQARIADVPEIKLTDPEKQALQAEVDKHLKDYGGGKQIGINEIAYEDNRLILTLPLPGEKKARAANEPITPLGVANCAYEYACLWSDTNFNGTRIARYACGTIALGAPFNSSVGSIHNNQTTGTQTLLLNGSRQILNGSLAPSRVNDTGVGSRANARNWTVC